MTTLTKLQLEQIERIQVVLNNMGCTYVIRQPDGTTHGSIDMFVKKARKRAPMKFPRGTVLNHYEEYLKNMKDGEAVLVPYDKFEPIILQGSIGSYCTRHWGKGTFVTTLRHDLQGVEVLRSGGI